MSIDHLYQAPLADFVAARNALAASQKKAGSAEEAERVKKLTKPSASAWAVNQLYWRERATFGAMIEAGDRLREALESGPSPEAEQARTDAIERARRATRDIVAASGQNVTETLIRRIATTLDALASYGSANPDPMRGRLTDDVSPLRRFQSASPRTSRARRAVSGRRDREARSRRRQGQGAPRRSHPPGDPARGRAQNVGDSVDPSSRDGRRRRHQARRSRSEARTSPSRSKAL